MLFALQYRKVTHLRYITDVVVMDAIKEWCAVEYKRRTDVDLAFRRSMRYIYLEL